MIPCSLVKRETTEVISSKTFDFFAGSETFGCRFAGFIFGAGAGVTDAATFCLRLRTMPFGTLIRTSDMPKEFLRQWIEWLVLFKISASCFVVIPLRTPACRVASSALVQRLIGRTFFAFLVFDIIESLIELIYFNFFEIGQKVAESRGVEPHTFYRTPRLAGGPSHRSGLLSELVHSQGLEPRTF